MTQKKRAGPDPKNESDFSGRKKNIYVQNPAKIISSENNIILIFPVRFCLLFSSS